MAIIQAPGIAEQLIHAFTAGRALKQRQQQIESETEDRKLQREMHQFQMKRLQLEDKLSARKHAFDTASLMEHFNRTAADAGAPALGPDQAGPPPEDINVGHAPVQIPAVPEMGLAATSVVPSTLQEKLAQIIQQKRAEASAEGQAKRESSQVEVPPAMAEAIGLPAGKVDPSVLTQAGEAARTRDTRASIEAEGGLNRESEERRSKVAAGAHIEGARLAAEASRGRTVIPEGDPAIDTFADQVHTGQIQFSSIPVKYKAAVSKHLGFNKQGILTPAQATKLDQFIPAEAAVEKLEGSLQKFLDTPATSPGDKVAAALQYEAERSGLTRLVGRALGEKGVFTDEDKKDFAKLLGTGIVGATIMPSVAQGRLKEIKSLMEKVRTREFENFKSRTGGAALPGAAAGVTHRFNPATGKIEEVK